jgi:hypothetical protein
MQTTNLLLVQNIVGRITHGLVGLDIYLNEKKSNNYLEDFLTLKEGEIKTALVSTSSKARLIPTAKVELSDEEEALIRCVTKVQKLILNLEKVGSEKEIENSINELGAKLDVIYKAMPSK